MTLVGCLALCLMVVEPFYIRFWSAYAYEALKIVAFAAIYGGVPAFFLDKRQGIMRSCQTCALSVASETGFCFIFYAIVRDGDFLWIGVLTPFAIALAIIAICVLIYFAGA